MAVVAAVFAFEARLTPQLPPWCAQARGNPSPRIPDTTEDAEVHLAVVGSFAKIEVSHIISRADWGASIHELGNSGSGWFMNPRMDLFGGFVAATLTKPPLCFLGWMECVDWRCF